MLVRGLRQNLTFLDSPSPARLALSHRNQDRLAEYTNDESLGRHFDLLLTVKSDKQRALNRAMRRRLRDSASMESLGGKSPRAYRTGMLVYFDSVGRTIWRTAMIEPLGVDLRGRRLAVCSGNQVHLYDLSKEVLTVFNYDWFAQLHSVHFSRDRERLLVASTGFDTIIEFNITSCEVTWFWCSWDHGYRLPPTGAKFVRKANSNTRFDRTERPCTRDEKECCAFGIPGGLTATHLNNAQYLGEDKILVTLFHQGKAIVFDRHTGRASVVLHGLLNPHGFEPAWHGEKVVTDTRRGEVIFLDENFRFKCSLKIDAAPPVVGREALSEWLQNVLPLRDDLYGAIDIHRSCIWIIDVERKRYRKVTFCSDWAVQSIVAVDAGSKLDEQLVDFEKVYKQISGSMSSLSRRAGQSA